ncbi:MAG: hypothetical protein AB7I48_17055, partial [Planctomycetaceae bacterium]
MKSLPRARCGRLTRLAAILLAALPVLSTQQAKAAWAAEFRVTFSRSVRERPFTGRVYLFFSRDAPEPRQGPDWFHPDPFLSLDVSDWQPDAELVLSP